MSALSRPVAGLKLAGRLRVCALVHSERNGAAPVAGLTMVTRRVAIVQWRMNWGCALALRDAVNGQLEQGRQNNRDCHGHSAMISPAHSWHDHDRFAAAGSKNPRVLAGRLRRGPSVLKAELEPG